MFANSLSSATTTACMLLAWACSSCSSNSSSSPESWSLSTPEEQGIDSATLATVIEEIDQRDLPVDSLQIVRNGYLVLDAYFYPYFGDRLHDVASVTKSVTSTVVGIAIDRGLLELEQPVLPLFPEVAPELPSDMRADIELQHLLSMTSGFDCGYEPGERELHDMIASDDHVKYALNLPMKVAPGTEFSYCSCGSHLLSAIITKVTGVSALDFAREHLFAPLDIEDVTWPSDPQGITRGWGSLQLHPRDMAKVGQLFLNRGNWNGTQVVSVDWVDKATRLWWTHTTMALDTAFSGGFPPTFKGSTRHAAGAVKQSSFGPTRISSPCSLAAAPM